MSEEMDYPQAFLLELTEKVPVMLHLLLGIIAAFVSPLFQHLVDNDEPSIREITTKLNELTAFASASDPEIRNQLLSYGAYAIVCRAWLFCCYTGDHSVHTLTAASKQCRDAIIKALSVLIAGFPEVMDDVGWQIISHALDKNIREQTHILTLKLIQTICIKSERNREFFTWNMDLMDPLLALTAKNRPSSTLLREWCLTLKALILTDDVQVSYNRAAERKLILAKEHILPTLASHLHHHGMSYKLNLCLIHAIYSYDRKEETCYMDLFRMIWFVNMTEYESDSETLNAVVILLASMAISDDICAKIEVGNVLPGIRCILRNHFHNKTLANNTVLLLRHLCTNNDVREKSSTHALMKWVVDILMFYKEEKEVIQNGLFCCANMTHKNVCQCAQFIVKNGLQLMLELAQEHYVTDTSVLKAVCYNLRNLIESGGVATTDKIIKAGYIDFLKKITKTIPALKEFYLMPVLRELEGEKVSTRESSLGEDSDITRSGSETVLIEPQVGRKSVLLDGSDDDEDDEDDNGNV